MTAPLLLYGPMIKGSLQCVKQVIFNEKYDIIQRDVIIVMTLSGFTYK